MAYLTYAIGIGSVICWIFVLTKMFKSKGVLHGILGLICGLYAFIWGWMNSSAHPNLKTVMLIWSVLLVIGIFLSATGTVALPDVR